MSDQYGQRMQRTQMGPQPPSRDPMSDAFRAHEAEVRAMQQAATTDPFLNGQDSQRRLKTDG